MAGFIAHPRQLERGDIPDHDVGHCRLSRATIEESVVGFKASELANGLQKGRALSAGTQVKSKSAPPPAKMSTCFRAVYKLFCVYQRKESHKYFNNIIMYEMKDGSTQIYIYYDSIHSSVVYKML